MLSIFASKSYLLKKQVLALTGKFRIYDPNGNLILFSEQKMFKLREDVRVYSGEDKQNEVLHIQARQIVDFSAAYDVFDQTEGRKVGALKRQGWKSIGRDQWIVMDADDRPIGTLIEDSLGKALLRRLLLGSLLPQDYDVLDEAGNRLADLKQHFKFFGYELQIDLEGALDPRLAVAGGILLALIEGKQQS